MRKRMARMRPLSGPDASAIENAAMSAGASLVGRSMELNVPDHAVWLACFTAAIGGTLAAQRKLPNPELIVRWCETFADRALVAARRRRKE